MDDITAQLGQIDVYLFDQLQRGRLPRGARVLEAGCGAGRNLQYLLQTGYHVSGVDADAGAVEAVRRMASQFAPSLPPENFRVEPVETLSFPDHDAQVVLSIAVLHFARDDAHFEAQLRSMWRVLRPNGLFFCRLASSIGMESRMKSLGGRRHLLPDGSERYLVDEAFLVEWTRRLGGTLLDPLKTTVVQDRRCMTTWVVRKHS